MSAMSELIWPDMRSGLVFVATGSCVDVLTDDQQRRVDVIPVQVSDYLELARTIDSYVFERMGD